MARKKKDAAQTTGSKLTVDMIVDHEKQYEEMMKVTFDDGNYVDIYKKFNPVKIEQTIMEHSKLIQELSEHKIEVDYEKMLKLYLLYVVLNFSTLAESLPKDFETRIKVVNYLSDSEYVDKIYSSFDQSETKKAIDALLDKFKLVADKMNTDEGFRKEVEDKLKEMNTSEGEENAGV